MPAYPSHRLYDACARAWRNPRCSTAASCVTTLGSVRRSCATTERSAQLPATSASTAGTSVATFKSWSPRSGSPRRTSLCSGGTSSRRPRHGAHPTRWRCRLHHDRLQGELEKVVESNYYNIHVLVPLCSLDVTPAPAPSTWSTTTRRQAGGRTARSAAASPAQVDIHPCICIYMFIDL